MKVLVIGGGAVGMMQARSLAMKGFEVTLVDKGPAGKESSWAGGGIISPLYPWRYSEAVSRLANWSQHYYPNLIESIEAESGIDPELTRHGMLLLHIDDLDRAKAWSEAQQAPMHEIDRTQIHELEPNIRPDVNQAIWLPHIASVRTPRLARALRSCLEGNERVQLLEGQAVVDFEISQDQVEAAITENGLRLTADIFIICSGAWSGLLSRSLKQEIPVRPVKGQMLAFQTDGQLVKRVVLENGKYLIPRRDGLVLVGSTIEYAEFDKTIDQETKRGLMEHAFNMVPSLSRCPVAHHWAGLRPGSPEGIPYVGRLGSWSNVYMNAGHFRNGLVIAPATVEILSSTLCNEPPPIDPSPYDPNRVLAS